MKQTKHLAHLKQLDGNLKTLDIEQMDMILNVANPILL